METAPIDAINANQIRAKLARELFDRCPAHLGHGIAITGSVARGVADKYSNVEVTVWVDRLRPVDTYLDWLDEAGARVDVNADWRLVEDYSLTTTSIYRGIVFEITWETWDALAEALTFAVAGEISDHDTLTKVWHVATAIPLRQHDELDHWQDALQHYPDDLQASLIEPIVRVWAEPHGYPQSPVNLWPLAQRNTRVALNARILREVERVLRIVFALNRRWEPDWKWLEPESKMLTSKPARLVERVNALVSTPDADESVRQCLQLIIETLALLPPEFDTELAHTRVREAFRPDAVL